MTSCTVTSTTVVAVLTTTSTSTKQVIFNVASFKNPPSTLPISGIVISRSLNSVTLETNTTTLNNITPDTLTSATISAGNTASQQIGLQSATVLITLTIKNQLSSQFKVLVKFPLWNPQNTNTNTQLPMLNTVSPTCTGVTTITSIGTCTFSSTTNILTVDSIIASAYTAGTQYTFTVSGVRNPYSAKPLSGFTITTQDQVSGSYDTLSSGITYTVTTAAAIDALELQLDQSAVNAQAVYYFSYRISLPMDQYCMLRLTGPTDLNIAQRFTKALAASVFSQSSGQNNTSDLTGNTITINGCNSGYTEQDSNFDTISIYNIANPAQIKDTGLFKVQLFALSAGGLSYIVAEDSTTIKVLATQLTTGSISSISLTPLTTLTVQEPSQYLISFTPSSSLLATSSIVITLPKPDSFFTLDTLASCNGVVVGVAGGLSSTGMTCVTSATANTITITNPWGTASYTGGTVISFTLEVGSGLQNPLAVYAPGLLTIQTYNVIDGTSYAVDYGTQSTLFTPTKGTMVSNLAASSSNAITFTPNVDYTLSFSPVHFIPIGGLIKVSIPLTDIYVYDQTRLTQFAHISLDGGTTYTLVQSLSFASGTLTISDAFANVGYTPGLSGTKVMLKVYGLRNPRTLLTSKSFTVDTADSSVNLIDSVSSGLSVTMTTLNQLNSLTLTQSNTTNGQLSDLTIAFNPETPLIATDKFTLTFPSEILLPTSPTCTGSVTCLAVGQKLVVTLTGAAATQQSFAFVVKSVGNAGSTRPSSVFTEVYTMDASENKISQYTASTLQLTNTLPAQASISSLYQPDKAAQALTQYTLGYTTVNAMGADGAFVVQYLSTAPFVSLTTCSAVHNGVTYPMTCTHNSGALKITMTGGSLPAILAGTSLQLIVGNFRNPSNTDDKSSMIITSYTDSTTFYSVDQASSNMVPGLTCSSQCKTCLSTNGASCTSCFTDGSTLYKYFDATTFKCLLTCPTTGYYADSSFVCQACLSRCLTCTTTSTCSSCLTGGSYPYLYNSLCYATCPDGTYLNSNNECQTCLSPCSTCTGPSNGQCKSCLIASGFTILNGATCISSCLDGQTMVNYACANCRSPCSKCSGTIYTCTACNSGYYLYGTSCIRTCPTGYYANTLTQTCTACTNNCQTCYFYFNNQICTKCVTNYQLFNQTCYVVCPSGFKSDGNGVCVRDTTGAVTPTPQTNVTNTTTNTANTTVALSNFISSSRNLGYPYYDLGMLLYMPMTLLFGIGFLVSLGSYFKAPRSYIASNTIAISATVENLAMLSQIALAFVTEGRQIQAIVGNSRRNLIGVVDTNASTLYPYPIVSLVTIFALAMVVLLNGVYGVFVCFSGALRRDGLFREWKGKHRRALCCTYGWSCLWSFKMGRFLYSRFLGDAAYEAQFEDPQRYLIPMNLMSILNILLSLLPLIFVDIWALSVYSWGSQFYLALIDSLVISILMLVFTIVDFKAGRLKPEDPNSSRTLDQSHSSVQTLLHNDNQSLRKLNEFSDIIDQKLDKHRAWWEDEMKKNGGQRDSQYAVEENDDLEKRERREVLKRLIEKLPKEQFQFLSGAMSRQQEQEIQDRVMRSQLQRRYSDFPNPAEKEEPSERYPNTYPNTPTNYKDYDGFGIAARARSEIGSKSHNSPLSLKPSQELSQNSLVPVLPQKSLKSLVSNKIGTEQLISKSSLSQNQRSLEDRSLGQESQMSQIYDSHQSNRQMSRMSLGEKSNQKQIQDLSREQSVKDVVLGGGQSQSSLAKSRSRLNKNDNKSRLSSKHTNSIKNQHTEEKNLLDFDDQDQENIDYGFDEQQMMSSLENQAHQFDSQAKLEPMDSEPLNEPLITQQDGDEMPLVKPVLKSIQQSQDLARSKSPSKLSKKSNKTVAISQYQDDIKSVREPSQLSNKTYVKSQKSVEQKSVQRDQTQMSKKSIQQSQHLNYEEDKSENDQQRQQTQLQSHQYDQLPQNFLDSIDNRDETKMARSVSRGIQESQLYQVNQIDQFGVNSKAPSQLSQINPLPQSNQSSKAELQPATEILKNDSSSVLSHHSAVVPQTQEIQKTPSQLSLKSESNHQAELKSQSPKLQQLPNEIKNKSASHKHSKQLSQPSENDHQQQQQQEESQSDLQPIEDQDQSSLKSRGQSIIYEYEEIPRIESIQKSKSDVSLEKFESQKGNIEKEESGDEDDEVQQIIEKSQKNLLEQQMTEEEEIEALPDPIKSRLQAKFDAVSKLSKYEEELDLNQDLPQTDNPKVSSSNQPSKLSVKTPIIPPQDDGRISTMLKHFEDENPDLLLSPSSALTKKDLQNQETFTQERFSPKGVDTPPNPENRNFNENDIMGDFERDERGDIIIKENKKGESVDKLGRRVNNKGYLVDDNNQGIIESVNRRLMFRNSELDDYGDLPAPFNLERYNFNPMEIFGHLDFNSHTLRVQGLPGPNAQGQILDKNGREVNRSGFLIDKDGNIIDKNGRRKFDRRHLIKKDDLPMLLNYRAKKFDIREVMGEFERDPKTGDVIMMRNFKGDYLDKQGRRVNKCGYLIDPQGNILNTKGKILWDHFALTKDGEFPKIFTFSKFNLDSITGEFEVDPLGVPILQRDTRGKLRDAKGRVVNSKGYLINDNGDVIDKKGNRVFKKVILDHKDGGDIPKVFRNGLLRKDTVDSFSRIMSEIDELERRQHSDYDPHDHYKIQTQKKRQLAGETPVDKLMEDTPSNYNLANQRFEQSYHENEIEGGGIMEDEKESSIGGRRSKMRRGKKVVKKSPYAAKQKKQVKKVNRWEEDDEEVTVPLSQRDALLSKAYGEQKFGQIGKEPLTKMTRNQSKLSKITHSISGFYKDPGSQWGGDNLSSRMKESDFAHQIPTFKDKKNKAKPEENSQQIDWKVNPAATSTTMRRPQHVSPPRSDSQNSFRSQSEANFQQMMKAMKSHHHHQPQMSTQYNAGVIPEGTKKGKKRIKKIETIYLQRLEPSIGTQRHPSRHHNPGQQIPQTSKAKFRDCHDRVWNETAKLAEDLSVRNVLNSHITENYKHMANQFPHISKDPSLSHLVDLKKMSLIKDKMLIANDNSTSKKDSNKQFTSRRESDIDEEGLNLFYGNRKQYERHGANGQNKIDISKVRK